MMKLHTKFKNFCCALLIAAIGLFLAAHYNTRSDFAFAEDEVLETAPHFVTIHDGGSYLTVKTSASTVKDVLERAKIELNDVDIVEPALDTKMEADNYNINIYRTRPALVIDGANRHYIMTASYDPKQVVREAGLTVYDGDEVEINVNDNFLEAGAVSTYKIERNGGRTVTEEESIGYPTETRYDFNLPKGERNLEQAGEDGRKTKVYEVQFENNIEVSRTLVSEEVTREPIPEIVVVGAKASIPPERQQCASWMREAGIPEDHLEAALYIVYHESGCRVDASNTASGAYGIPQALPGSKMASAGADWETNPVTQLRWMDSYVRGRYGGWPEAVNFKQSHGWY